MIKLFSKSCWSLKKCYQYSSAKMELAAPGNLSMQAGICCTNVFYKQECFTTWMLFRCQEKEDLFFRHTFVRDCVVTPYLGSTSSSDVLGSNSTEIPSLGAILNT